MSIYADARHGIVCTVKEGPANYFGWPSVAILEDGTIVAGSSGLRHHHVCPWGKSVLNYSTDGGETYSEPVVAHDDLVDNRDLGVVALGGQSFAITWFSIDVSKRPMAKWFTPDEVKEAEKLFAKLNASTAETLIGSWTKITRDGGKTWTRPIRVPVSSPHGFIRLKNGDLGYYGKAYREDLWGPGGPLQYHVSSDGGFTWAFRGEVGLPEGYELDQFHEAHVIELKDGRLMGAIRVHLPVFDEEGNRKEGYDLDTALSFSDDGGRTWTLPERMNIAGSPPHLLRHSSGAIVLSFGYRHPGYGQRAVVSYDEGKTWSDEIIIRDDGPSGDLGYPCSIELADGSVYTVYYQQLPGEKKCSLLWSKWKLPER